MTDELVEKQLETNEIRLNDHAERIRILEKGVAVTDSRVDSLCEALEKTNKSLNLMTGTLATALVGFFFYMIQTGLFK